tara:strand:+ start:468 stop:704 length:237 start_codon:yes stop_codon:yes gene_type:complete
MATISGKENEMKEMKPSELSEQQIVDLAKWANILNEENKNLKGYILQLQGQLTSARQGRALAQHQVQTQTNIISIEDE